MHVPHLLPERYVEERIFPLFQPKGISPRHHVPDSSRHYDRHSPHLIGRQGGGGVRMGPEAGGEIGYVSEFEPFNLRLWNKNEN